MHYSQFPVFIHHRLNYFSCPVNYQYNPPQNLVISLPYRPTLLSSLAIFLSVAVSTQNSHVVYSMVPIDFRDCRLDS